DYYCYSTDNNNNALF
nr:immunoglobulin light chain junction region [Macaca mulatta]MOW02827.1 immunoglobulin light chain junction region [Macaca mulatta]MOW03645.1 immunoglobulin light chain junction region [Macaca mulatta]